MRRTLYTFGRTAALGAVLGIGSGLWETTSAFAQEADAAKAVAAAKPGDPVEGPPAVGNPVIGGNPAPTKTGEAPNVSEAEAKLAEQFFNDGRALFFQGKYPEAAAKLLKAVEAQPAKTSYKLQLAKAYLFAKQTDKAADVLQQIVLANPDHVEAGVELAELLSPQKQPDRVIALLEPLLKFKHDYPLYHLLAEAYYQKEAFDKARDHFEEAIKLNPQSGGDFYQLGNIYLAQKRFAKAASAYESAGALGVSSGVYHFKLASVYFNLHNYLGNVGTAEVVGGQPGQLSNTWFLLSAAPGAKNQFYVSGPRSAIYQVAKAQSLGVDVFDIQYLEAQIWLSARRYTQADALFKTLQAKAPKEEQGAFWFQWSQTALGLNQLDEYLARLEKAIAVEPELYQPMLADAHVTVANRWQQRGETDKYLKSLAQAVSVNPLSARMHLSLGDAYWQASKVPLAVEQYRLVLEIQPDHPQRVLLLNRIRGQDAGVAAVPVPVPQ